MEILPLANLDSQEREVIDLQSFRLTVVATGGMSQVDFQLTLEEAMLSVHVRQARFVCSVHHTPFHTLGA